MSIEIRNPDEKFQSEIPPNLPLQREDENSLGADVYVCARSEFLSSPFEKGRTRGISFMLPYKPQLKIRARSFRSNLTDVEKRLWSRLRRKQLLGIQFRQKPIDNYIIDFHAPSVHLVVEVDGSQHFDPRQAEYDKRRSKFLEQQGLLVLRFDDRQVLTKTEAVAAEIFKNSERESFILTCPKGAPLIADKKIPPNISLQREEPSDHTMQFDQLKHPYPPFVKADREGFEQEQDFA